MKKKLETELISIAHRILKLKNKSELIQLHQETQKLYEKLSVLLFVENHFSETKPTIGQAQVMQKLEIILDDVKDIATTMITYDENKVVERNENAIRLNDTIEFVPVNEISKPENGAIEPTEAKPISIQTTKQTSFEHILTPTYGEPIFEKVNYQKETIIQTPTSHQDTEIEIKEITEKSIDPKDDNNEIVVQKPASLNDILSKTINIGLNDRIGFEKQLFAGNGEDMNRVISQLSTFGTLQEAHDFIENMVKPDYNNWDGKEDYVKRFIAIVEKKFS